MTRLIEIPPDEIEKFISRMLAENRNGWVPEVGYREAAKLGWALAMRKLEEEGHESCSNCVAYLEGSAEWEDEARLATLKLIGVRKEIELALVEVRADLSTVYGTGKRISDILERALRESK